MNVGFYLIGGENDVRSQVYYETAATMVASVRQVMPKARVVQMTDQDSPRLADIDEVRRGSSHAISLARTQQRTECDGEWLFLDTDVIVLKDVSPIFSLPFEIALADRNWTSKGDRPMHGMRFNVGVIFSKGTRFWQRLLARLQMLPIEDQVEWMADQRMIDRLVRSGRYQVEILSGSVYNYPPATPDDRPRLAKILHFKGEERKQWMLEEQLACA